MRRRTYVTLSGVVALTTLAGCGESGEPEEDDSASSENDPTEPADAESDPSDSGDEGDEVPVEIESVSIERRTEQDLSLPRPVERPTEIILAVEYTTRGVEQFELTAALQAAETVELETTATVTADDESPYQVELSTDGVEFGAKTLVVTAEVEGETARFEKAAEIDSRPLTDREHWEAAYERSIEQLEEALIVYGEQATHGGDDATLMHVLPSMEISVDDAEAELSEANRWEDRAWDVQGRLSGDEFERTRELRRNIRIVEDLVRCQERFHAAFNTLDTEWDVWEDDSGSSTDRPAQGDIESAEALFEEIEELLEDWETVLDLIEDKVEQADWQLEQLETMQEGVDLMWQATIPEFTTIDQVRLARQDFESVEGQLENTDSAAPSDITDEGFLDLAETWREEAEEIERDLIDSDSE